MIRRRSGSAVRRARKMPATARLSDSVPPEVKNTSLGRAPSAAAMLSLDSSTRRRAARPELCRDDALPVSEHRLRTWRQPPPAEPGWWRRGRDRSSQSRVSGKSGVLRVAAGAIMIHSG